MNVFSIPTMSKINKLYDKCESALLNNNYQDAIVIANEALALFNDQNIKRFENINDIEIFHANFYSFKAEALSNLDVERYFQDIYFSYEKAIEITENSNSGLKTLTNSCFNIIDLCLYNESELVKKYLESCIKYAKIIIDKSNTKKECTLGQVRLASLYSTCYPKDDHFIKSSIELFEGAIKFFKKNDMRQEVFLSMFHLSRVYQSPLLRGDPANLEKSIYYCQESLNMQEEVDITAYEMGVLSQHLAHAFTHRKYGEKRNNVSIAKASYIHAIEYQESVDKKLSIPTLIEFLKLIIKGEKLEAKTLTYLTEKIECSFRYIDIKADQDNWFDLLICKYKLESNRNLQLNAHQLSDKYTHELKKLINHIKKEQNPFLWIDVNYALISQIYNKNDTKIINKCVNIYTDIINLVNTLESRLTYFDAYVRLGSCYVDLKKWDYAYKYFKQAMSNVDQDIANDFKIFGSSEYALPSNNTLLQDISITALYNNDIVKSLKWHDYINSRKGAFIFEDIYMIEKQVNRLKLFKDYIKMIQGQRVIFSFENSGTIENIEQISYVRKKLDQLKEKEEFISRKLFYKNLDKVLSCISSWTLIPVISNDSLINILIPPNSSISDIVISPCIKTTFKQEVSNLVDENYGLTQGIHEFSKNDDYYTLSNSLLKIGGNLDKKYTGWAKSIINNHDKKNINTLCIVADGLMSFQPFSLSYCSSEEKFFIDHMNIHYAPSLYSLYTIEERLKSYNNRKNIGFIGSSEEASLPSTRLESTLIQNYLRHDEFSEVTTDEIDIDNVKNVLADANHWHFAAHGKFHWSESHISYIEFGDKKMPVSYLSMLQAKWFLRLVILSSCESGLHNFFTPDSEAEGLLLKFMELGSCGAIGALWEQPDFSAALLMDKFYYFYIKRNMAPTHALRSAQLWLRDVKKPELCTFLSNLDTENPNLRDLIKESLIDLEAFEDNEAPFSHPIYWGGFVFWGK